MFDFIGIFFWGPVIREPQFRCDWMFGGFRAVPRFDPFHNRVQYMGLSKTPMVNSLQEKPLKS